ncbi:peptidoglycan-binding protein [Phyllobacterium salinisoli]|uniref:Peptidoglycan-binding protein n=1 Tax=Phyllobacterium salinisoli TaxID=1899321 RepID=A0A368K7U8_9HYPH|nr:L,D-transpeptidase family protein [Phyllobacterium salinisoli]RCS25301.1 peptidoglycan-binding protein [Phyllobacterium salinisoli]
MNFSSRNIAVARNKALAAAAIGAVLAVTTALTATDAMAASTLLELFRQKKQAQTEMAPPTPPAATVRTPRAAVEAPAQPRASAGQPATPIKRITVKGPQIYDYKPDALVRVDFSKFDMQMTAATEITDRPQIDGITSGMPPLPPKASADADTNVFVEAIEHLKATDVRAEKQIADAIVDFYSAHQKFLWSTGLDVASPAKEVAALFAKAGEDGLDPEEYAVVIPADNFDKADEQDRLKKLADFEILLTARALRYAIDAGEGRITADRLSEMHDLPRGRVKARDVLEKLAVADDPAAYLASFHPQSKWYAELKRSLADLDGRENDVQVQIAPGTLIRPGDENPEVANVVALILKKAPADYLEKHQAVLGEHESATVYDPALVAAIKDYQKQAGSQPDGVIGRNTISTLQSESTAVKRDRILYAMERLRWLPHDFGNRYVFVNQPAYRAQYFADGQEKVAMNVVVGSPRHQTYFFYNKIQTVVFNPSWGVPRSIILNEMMPKILRDPGYLGRNGYEVYQNGKRVPSSSVNWSRIAAGQADVGIRQIPSLDNSLGELKILFPNSHDIYMHDTPAKSYFKRDMRALSHGCIRLERPRDMAAAVLDVPVESLNKYFGKNERGVKVPEQIPVYISYFTAWPDASTGKIRYYDDVYERDAQLAKAMEKTRVSRLANS